MCFCSKKQKKKQGMKIKILEESGNFFQNMVNREVEQKINFIKTLAETDVINVEKMVNKPTKKLISQFDMNQENQENIPQYSAQDLYDVVKLNGKPIMELRPFQITILSDEQQNQIIQPFISKGKVWGKDGIICYNQIIGQKNENILNQSHIFVTSNIVDAYANYLMIEDEKKYFSIQDVEEREKYKRVLIFTSDFITDCGIDEVNEKKWFYLFTKHLQNFEAIRYQFHHIYEKIIFLVCLNSHWIVLNVTLQEGYIKVFDSLPKPIWRYEKFERFLNSIFSKLFNKNMQLLIQLNLNLPRQQDGYSCGYFSCIALKNLCEETQQTSDKFISKQEMKTILRDLLIDN